jgi:hypothetical protein
MGQGQSGDNYDARCEELLDVIQIETKPKREDEEDRSGGDDEELRGN